MNVEVAVLLLAAALQVHALPGGPPSGACANIFPVGHTIPANTVAAPTDIANSPYELNLQGFLNNSDPQNPTYLYHPGGVYMLTVTAPDGGTPYRGVMVQARTVPGNLAVGSFSSFTANTQASVCTPPESAVTHNSPVEKTCEVLTWTAPVVGTGDIMFRYAVVVRYSPGSLNMFYATLITDTIAETPLPPSGNNPTCPVDECAMGTNNCDVNAMCIDTADSFTCTCNPGFTGDGTSCVSIDECTLDIDNCDDDATCTDTAGSFTCACNSGFSGDGVTCVPLAVDECAMGTDNCDVNAMCTDTAESFTCTCNPGFTGDGTSCVSIDECTLDIDNCDDDATCTDTVGSFTCACNSGFSGDGVTCVPLVNECAMNTDNCNGNATCTDTDASFMCTCNTGFIGDGVTCTSDVDCDGDPCDENAECIELPGTGNFRCRCMPPFQGDGLSCTCPSGGGDDPHFSIMLPTGQLLCFTVQGEHNFAFNLISNEKVQMNAMFLPDSRRSEVTWMGSIGITVMNSGYKNFKSNTTSLRFVAKENMVYIGDKVVLLARNIEKLTFTNGKLNISEAPPVEGFKYPEVLVDLQDVSLSFSIKFMNEHLDIFWRSTGVQTVNSHGLIGQFFRKGIEIDEVRKILIMANKEPVPVMRRPMWSFMEREMKDDQLCWTAMNPGYEGEGLIDGTYFDYLVNDVLSTEFQFKKQQ